MREEDGYSHDNNHNEEQYQRNVEKKEFLKRNSKKVVIPPTSNTQKYNYYIDNFDENKKSKDTASSTIENVSSR